MKSTITTRKGEIVQNPPFFTKLFNSPIAALLWLPIRVWLGWQWIEASLHKLESPAWMQTGEALKGFWAHAVAIPETGNPAIHYAWYRSFLQMMLDAQAYTWFAKLIAVGEFTIGLALILGLFTGLTAFLGGFMNWNFMMAGSASVNPMFFAISVLLVAAWKVAGYFGVDYFLVPWVGDLWAGKKEEPRAIPAGIPSGAKAK
jgi:thiosulfate dehydrogenase [quinone] large subunit